MKVHILGIGGAGMSAIARLMHARGYQVTGDDRIDSPVLAQLRAEGILTWVGHDPAHLDGIDAVAPSSALAADEPVLVEARRRNLKVWHRGDLLNMLMQGRVGIAIAGTHGKTTTSDMVAKILTDSGADPSYIVGGASRVLASPAHAGEGPAFVVEADEYDRTFLRLMPTIAVITSVAHDHPDTYRDAAETLAAFTQFAMAVPAEGALVTCADDPGAVEVARRAASGAPREHDIDYGIHRGAWRALNPRANPLGGFDFSLRTLDGRSADVSLRVPGHHNVLNALAALAVADLCGVPLDQAADSLGGYHGAARRFEYRGEKHGARLFDDYAHNPGKIQATLSGARFRFPVGNIWAVWQPHTYSRTLALLDEFADAFKDADEVVVLPVYAARENLADFGPDADKLNPIAIGRAIKHPRVRSCASIQDAVGLLASQMRPGDIVISLSAGDGNRIIDQLAGMP